MNNNNINKGSDLESREALQPQTNRQEAKPVKQLRPNTNGMNNQPSQKANPIIKDKIIETPQGKIQTRIFSDPTPKAKPQNPQHKRPSTQNGQANSQNNQSRSRNNRMDSPKPRPNKINNVNTIFEINDDNTVDIIKNVNQKLNNDKSYDNHLKIMFLGGIGEIGKNITAFEYDNEIVIIDAGLSFPTVDMPGIDIVIPDFTYLKNNKDKIKALLLTHGHEDHIGGVPYFLKEMPNVPVYGTKLTLALLENKLREHKLDNIELNTIADKVIIKAGRFSAEFIHVSHSVAGSVAIVLTTPVGNVFHTGDFKIDYTPLAGEIMNLNRIAEIGRRGVLLLLSESTNVERAGYTMSESVVGETLHKIFAENLSRRIIIATFASNVDRLQQILELAKEFKRKVAVSGRSMLNVIDTASRVGILHYDQDLIIEVDKITNMADKNLVILSTGSQGEPMSALTRMSNDEFNGIKLGANDTIVISASPIPGNERDVYKVVNNLYRLGAQVIYDRLADVHVSGHACQEELKLIHTLLKPKYFIPIHGEYRHLKQHSMLAQRLGMSEKNIIIPEIGDVVLLSRNRFVKKGTVPNGNILVDGLGVGDVGNVVLRDRLVLSTDGLLLVSINVDTVRGMLSNPIDIISRGFIYTAEGTTSSIVDEMKVLITNIVGQMDLKDLNVNQLKSEIQRVLRNYLFRKIKRNPMIIPIISAN